MKFIGRAFKSYMLGVRANHFPFKKYGFLGERYAKSEPPKEQSK